MSLRASWSAIAAVMACATAHAGVLLIPDSGNDRIWAFSSVDGSLISDNIIAADGNMLQPISAVDSGFGTVLVGDENADAVFEYSYSGSLIRTVVGPADGLDAVNGITVHNGQIYITQRTSTVIKRVNYDGTGLTDWATTNIDTARDIEFRAGDALVTDSGTENIERFSLTGAFLSTFVDSDGVTGVDFPQQIQSLSNGNVLVAGFSPPAGIYLYDSAGNQLSVFDVNLAVRGVYQLENGNYMYSGGTRVGVYDPVAGTFADIVNQSGASFRYIEFSNIPAPTALSTFILAGMCAGRRRR